MKTIEKHNNYGVLVTVASLLLIVVYSEENHDSWDLVVCFLTGFFGISYLIEKSNSDWFSSFVASFISVASITTALITMSTIYVSKYIENISNVQVIGFSYHLIVILILSVAISIYVKPQNA